MHCQAPPCAPACAPSCTAALGNQLGTVLGGVTGWRASHPTIVPHSPVHPPLKQNSIFPGKDVAYAAAMGQEPTAAPAVKKRREVRTRE